MFVPILLFFGYVVLLVFASASRYGAVYDRLFGG